MGIPTNLFIDSQEVGDSSTIQLSHNIEEWPEQIITALKERLGSLEGFATIVKFKKEDPEMGTATGSIAISNEKNQCHVPVIIQEFKMFPLDMFLGSGKLLPLTPDYFAITMTNNDPLGKLTEFPTYSAVGRFDDGNIWSALYPPSLGRYAFASDKYPMLTEIIDNLSSEHIKEFKEKIANDNGIAIRFQKSNHVDLIQKLANAKPVNMNAFSQSVENLVDRNIFVLKKDGPNKYTLLSNSDKVFSPQVVNISKEEACSLVVKATNDVDDFMNDVDQNGEKILYMSQPITTVHIDTGYHDNVEVAKEFGIYKVKKKNGVSVEGFYIPAVINYDMSVLPYKMFLGKTNSVIQESIAGVRVTNSNYRLDFCDPKIGQTGTFVYLQDGGKALATAPVNIVSMVDRGGKIYIKAMDLLGSQIKLALDKFMDGDTIFKMDDGYYRIPYKMKWVSMEGFDEISNNPADYAVKTASEQRSVNPIEIHQNGCFYNLKGLGKYASEMKTANIDLGHLSKSELMLTLASIGTPANIVADVLTKCASYEKTVLHGTIRPLTLSEKTAELKKLLVSCEKVAGKFKSDLIKAASFVDSAHTVDSLLSLNFASPENTTKFVGKIPRFKAAISDLLNCLMASRIGIKQIPEQATSSAVLRLIEVVNGLEELRAVNEAQ
jgi:hypothetical protein